MSKPILNPSLEIVKPEWKGNPLSEDGIYKNIDKPSTRGFKDLMKWQFSGNDYSDKKKNQRSNVKVIKDPSFINDSMEGFTWLGHASYLFRLGGKNFITDPVVDRIWPMKRYTDFPVDPYQIDNLDYILLSHNHRDHCDEASLKLVCKNNPKAKIFTGLEMKNVLNSWNLPNPIIEAGWYQKYPTDNSIKITYLPARHWCRRYLWDTNRELWGSYMITVDSKNYYFGADSGLGSHFAEIKKIYGTIDYAFLGIGAYEPVWFMKGSHTSPSDILKVKEILDCKYLVPMHYGTFDLSDEPIDNPKKELRKLVKNDSSYLFLEIGRKHVS